MDLYNIPGDTGGNWRLNKFLDYRHYVPYVDVTTLTHLVEALCLDENEQVMLAWYHSLAYSEVTAALLLDTLDYKKIQPRTVEEFWAKNKEKLQFVSARMYVKNMDWFIPLTDKFMKEVLRQPYKWVVETAGEGTPREKYDRLYKEMMKWKFMGRFSVELFLLALVDFYDKGLIDIALAAPLFHWNDGSNVTSGLLNILYMDEEADAYDKNGTLSKDLIPVLEQGLNWVMETSRLRYPEDDSSIAVITPRMCSWRNLFKGARYGGYHHDRQLEQIRAYEKSYPDKQNLWDTIYKIRKRAFVPTLLGEVGGWTGIRKERKKLWLKEGLIGYEVVS